MNTLINIQHTKKKFKFWKNGDLYLNLSARHTRPSYSSNKRKRIGQQFVTQFDKFGYGDGGGVIRCCCHVRKAICPYSNGQSTQQFGIHLARCDVMIQGNGSYSVSSRQYSLRLLQKEVARQSPLFQLFFGRCRSSFRLGLSTFTHCIYCSIHSQKICDRELLSHNPWCQAELLRVAK